MILALQKVFAALGGPRRLQAGALCWRPGETGIEILLITTRRTRRWTPPKGSRIDGKTLRDSAAIEAREEAGALGVVAPEPIGRYHYLKLRKSGWWQKREIELYPLRVTRLEDDFLEKHERERAWMPVEAAAEAVREKDLAALIRAFAASAPDARERRSG